MIYRHIDTSKRLPALPDGRQPEKLRWLELRRARLYSPDTLEGNGEFALCGFEQVHRGDHHIVALAMSVLTKNRNDRARAEHVRGVMRDEPDYLARLDRALLVRAVAVRNELRIILNEWTPRGAEH